VLIEVNCPNCGKHLKAPENMAGKQAKCPGCQQTLRLPVMDSSAAPAATNPNQTKAATATTAADATWRMATPDGQEYGPVSQSELETWVADGRIDESCQLYHEGWTNWKPAAEIFPQLRPRPATPIPAQPAANIDLGFDAVTAPASQGISDFHTAPAGPPPRHRSGPLASQRNAAEALPAIDALAWLPVKIGLGLSQLACLVLAIAVGSLLIFEVIGYAARSPSSESLIRFVAAVGILAGSGMIGGCVALVIGWFIGRTTPRESRATGLNLGAVICAGAVLLLLTITVLLATFQTGRPDVNLLKALTVLVTATMCGGLILNAFYLGMLGRYFQRPNTFTLAIVCVVMDGIWLVWTLLSTFVIKPDSQTVVLLMALIPNSVMLADLILRLLMNASVKRAIGESARI